VEEQPNPDELAVAEWAAGVDARTDKVCTRDVGHGRGSHRILGQSKPWMGRK
jgi:hypothetical protein